ncbi:hypothetical protein B7494_g8563 [Chlorociboria aeruginascens]|nr:hypothetical protein B7494_g8563 [Chlorociboria aeruginascens]
MASSNTQAVIANAPPNATAELKVFHWHVALKKGEAQDLFGQLPPEEDLNMLPVIWGRYVEFRFKTYDSYLYNDPPLWQIVCVDHNPQASYEDATTIPRARDLYCAIGEVICKQSRVNNTKQVVPLFFNTDILCVRDIFYPISFNRLVKDMGDNVSMFRFVAVSQDIFIHNWRVTAEDGIKRFTRLQELWIAIDEVDFQEVRKTYDRRIVGFEELNLGYLQDVARENYFQVRSSSQSLRDSGLHVRIGKWHYVDEPVFTCDGDAFKCEECTGSDEGTGIEEGTGDEEGTGIEEGTGDKEGTGIEES